MTAPRPAAPPGTEAAATSEPPISAFVMEHARAINRELAERDEAREELATLQEQVKGWPLCPDGCGCRLGTTGPDGENDADARDCACDGPCCMECRENGYPDAPSYRDMAVAPLEAQLVIAAEEAVETDRALMAVVADRDALSGQNARLAGERDRYRQALDQVRRTAEYFGHKGELDIATAALGDGG